MNWLDTHEIKPKIGKEVLFYYDDFFHIGYLIDDNGSDKPRKWTWYSYVYKKEIEDMVYFFSELIEPTKE